MQLASKNRRNEPYDVSKTPHPQTCRLVLMLEKKGFRFCFPWNWSKDMWIDPQHNGGPLVNISQDLQPHSNFVVVDPANRYLKIWVFSTTHFKQLTIYSYWCVNKFGNAWRTALIIWLRSSETAARLPVRARNIFAKFFFHIRCNNLNDFEGPDVMFKKKTIYLQCFKDAKKN